MSKNINEMETNHIRPIKKCEGLSEKNKEFIINNAYVYKTWGLYLEGDDPIHVYESKNGEIIAKIEEDWNGEYSLMEYSQRIEEDAFAQMEISKRWRFLEEERKEMLGKYIGIIEKTKGISSGQKDKLKRESYEVWVRESKYGDWFEGRYVFSNSDGELLVEIKCDGEAGEYELKRLY